MAELPVGDQLIRFDRDATISVYSQIVQGDANSCGCSGCRNFALLRNKAYPDAFRDFLDMLGVDPSKEIEAVYYGPKGELHSYGVWFYFVGELLEAGERSVRIGDEFHYWIRAAFPRRSAEFGQTVAAVECATIIPWALGEADDPELSVQMAKAEDIMHRYRNALRALANTDR